MELILDNIKYGKVRVNVNNLIDAVEILNAYVETTRIASSDMNCDFGSVYLSEDDKYAEICYNGHVIEMQKRNESKKVQIVNGQVHTEPQEFFNIPSMCIHKDDILAQYDRRDDFEKIKEKVEKLSDSDMQQIANNMTDMMMDDFNLSIREAYEKVKNEKS